MNTFVSGFDRSPERANAGIQSGFGIVSPQMSDSDDYSSSESAESSSDEAEDFHNADSMHDPGTLANPGHPADKNFESVAPQAGTKAPSSLKLDMKKIHDSASNIPSFQEGRIKKQSPRRSRANHLRDFSSDSFRSSATTQMKYSKRFSLQPHSKSPTKSEFGANDDRKSDDFTEKVGEEPGVDVETMYVDLPDSQGSQLTIVDYSPENYNIAHYDVEKDGGCIISGTSGREMLRHHIGDALEARPSWSRVRWIMVNGLSWEAIQPIATKYRLHPLAVEDMLDIPQRTKMEVYHEQIFCCFPLHLLTTSPTPYSFFHKCTRYIILQIIALYAALKWTVVAIFAITKRCFTRKSETSKQSDPEKEPRSSKVASSSFSSSDSKRLRKVCYGPTCTYLDFSESYGSGESSKYPFKLSKRSVDWSQTATSSSSSRRWMSSESTLCDPFEEDLDDQCIPFYTLEHGTLCGGAETSPVAEKLRKMPSRSLYEWNQGNLALKREALQNMRIPGSGNSIEIALEQVSLFIVGDTIITFFEKSAPAIYGPLEARLKSSDTMLRHSSDPAILVQALLDVSVDLIGPILNEYRTRLSNLQIQSIRQPNLQHTRALHAFITDLTVLRPPLSSLASIVEALWSRSFVPRSARRRDRRRRHTRRHHATDPFSDKEDSEREGDGDSRSRTSRLRHQSLKDHQTIKRLISDSAALYFGDVSDHALRYLQDLDDMRSQSKTLSSLIFNTISIRAGDSVKMLSLVSVVFLPLTFLTGYFGMNFHSFKILEHDVGYYWIVATPAAAALTAFLMYPTLVSQCQATWSWIKSLA